MTYGELADNFQLSFPEGRFNSYHYLGGNILKLMEFKISKDAAAIGEAIVAFNQNGKTIVVNNETNEITEIAR